MIVPNNANSGDVSTSWYAIDFSHRQIEDWEHLRLRRRFHEDFLSAGSPRGLTLFSSKVKGTLMTHYYLPPSAAQYCPELLHEFSAEPIDPVSPSTLVVSSGTWRDLDFWFPGSDRGASH